MAVTLSGTGGLFVRLGRIFHGLRSANLYLGSTDISGGGLKAAGVTSTDIAAQFQSALQNVPDGLFTQRDSVRSALGSWKNYLKALAETTLVEQVHADVTLTDKSVTGALKELITQMAGVGTVYSPDNKVDACTTSATVTAAGGNTGNGVLVCSVVRKDGRNNELALAETLEAVCTSDAQQGGTARSETFQVKGEPANSDPLAFDWPGGSSASTTITATDASLDASGNLLTNSDFESFTVTNTPDNFSILVGAAGTDIFAEATTVYRTGGKALKFTGTGGSPLSSVAQTFNESSTGTAGTLKPNTVYAVCFFARKSASLAAGVLEVGLVDGSNSAVADDAGTANTKQVAHGTLTTSFAAYTAFFRTPKVLPTTAKLRVRVSTALTSGESVYVDDLAMCEATELYTGGPFAAIFAGSTNFILNDQVNVAVANDRAGDFQIYFDRVFDLRNKGLQLPSDTGGGETLADSLIA